MNKVVLTGRVTAQPKIQQAGELKIAKYSLAVDRKYKREGQPTVDFINIVAFRHQAEFAEKYLKKGMKIGVSGSIQTGSYKAQDGSTRYTTDIIADEHEFLQNKSENATESVTTAGDVSPQQDSWQTRTDWHSAAQEELPFI